MKAFLVQTDEGYSGFGVAGVITSVATKKEAVALVIEKGNYASESLLVEEIEFNFGDNLFAFDYYGPSLTHERNEFNA